MGKRNLDTADELEEDGFSRATDDVLRSRRLFKAKSRSRPDEQRGQGKKMFGMDEKDIPAFLGLKQAGGDAQGEVANAAPAVASSVARRLLHREAPLELGDEERRAAAAKIMLEYTAPLRELEQKLAGYMAEHLKSVQDLQATIRLCVMYAKTGRTDTAAFLIAPLGATLCLDFVAEIRKGLSALGGLPDMPTIVQQALQTHYPGSPLLQDTTRLLLDREETVQALQTRVDAHAAEIKYLADNPLPPAPPPYFGSAAPREIAAAPGFPASNASPGFSAASPTGFGSKTPASPDAARKRQRGIPEDAPNTWGAGGGGGAVVGGALTPVGADGGRGRGEQGSWGGGAGVGGGGNVGGADGGRGRGEQGLFGGRTMDTACRYWDGTEGSCSNGKVCRFYHAPAPSFHKHPQAAGAPRTHSARTPEPPVARNEASSRADADAVPRSPFGGAWTQDHAKAGGAG
ncbi:hypothetical protein T484DRAFT_1827477, partial [Baffinella frigidus]